MVLVLFGLFSFFPGWEGVEEAGGWVDLVVLWVVLFCGFCGVFVWWGFVFSLFSLKQFSYSSDAQDTILVTAVRGCSSLSLSPRTV